VTHSRQQKYEESGRWWIGSVQEGGGSIVEEINRSSDKEFTRKMNIFYEA